MAIKERPDHKKLEHSVNVLKRFFRNLPETIRIAESAANQVAALDTAKSIFGNTNILDYSSNLNTLRSGELNLRSLIDASDSLEQDMRFHRGIMNHNSVKYYRVGSLKSDSFEYQLECCLKDAKENGYSFMSISVNDGADDKEDNHWVSVFITKNIRTNQLTTYYFNPCPGYTHAPEAIKKTLECLGEPYNFIQLASNDIQESGTADCAALSALYIYLSKLQYQDVDFKQAQSEPNRIFRDLVGVDTACNIYQRLRQFQLSPLDALKEITQDGSHNMMETLRALEFQQVFLKCSQDKLYDTMSTIFDALVKILDNPTLEQSDQIILILSILSVGTGISAHILLATLAGSGGIVFSGVRMLNHSSVNCKEAQEQVTEILKAVPA